MPSTFSGNYTATVVLNNGTQNPATVTSTGRIVVSTGSSLGSALYGNNAAGWVITNLGTVTDSVANNFGVNLSGGLASTITNGSPASTTPLISGTRQGVNIQNAPGTVSNYGTISQIGAAGYNAIFLNLGGSVHNAGMISSQGNTGNGITTNANFSTVSNSGTITAQGTSSNGINLTSGGSVTNGSSASPAGFIGGVATGINTGNGSGTPSTVVNFGTISGTGSGPGSVSSTGIFLGNGGTVTNLGTVSIANASNGTGIIFAAVSVNPSQITNGQSGSNTGLITAYHDGIADNSTSKSSTITNYGTIQSTQTGVSAGSGFTAFAVQSLASATVKNFGAILSAETGGGGAILLSAGGRITNGQSGSTGGLIAGAAAAINVSGGPGIVSNFGTITGTASGGGTVNSNALFLTDGGTVTNLGTISDPFANNGSAVNIGTTAGAAIINGQSGSNLGLITAYHNGIFGGTGGPASTVTNYGTIESTQTAVAPVTGFTGESILLNSGGSLKNFGLIETLETSGGGNGILIQNAAGTVANYGTIKSGLSASNTSGSAVYLGAGGNVTNGGINLATALISAGRQGVFLHDAGTVTNFGTVSNISTVLNSGSLHGSGVLLERGGLLVNGTLGSSAALIESPELGVYLGGIGGVPNGTAGAVVNFGTIESTGTAAYASDAIAFASGGTATNFGTISAANSNAVHFDTTTPGTLNNSALIENFGTVSAVYLGGGGTVTNQAGATITSPQTAISTHIASLTVSNSGTIQTTSTGTSGTGIYLGAGGSITNFASGLITGRSDISSIASGDVTPPTAAPVTVTNYGTITGNSPTSSAIALSMGGLITNKTNGAISGPSNAIEIKGTTGIVNNFGSISGDTTGTSGDGVYLSGGGTVTNQSAALITSNLTGVAFHSVPATVINSGTIQTTSTGTSGTGVYLGAGGSVMNTGLITGRSDVSSFLPGFAVPPTAAAITVTNYGTLTGTLATTGAINASMGATVTNKANASITGGEFGLNLRNAAGTVTNYGGIGNSLPASAAFGAGIYLQSGGTITNGTGGTISGNPAGVYLGGTAATGAGAVLTNFGLITGNVGVAVSALDTGANTIVNYGAIIGTGGTAVSFTGDPDTLVVEPGATFSGAVANFGANDVIDFANVVATGETFSNGVLALTNNGNVVESIDLSGSFVPGQFSLKSDGSGGYDIGVSPLSIAAPVSLTVAIGQSGSIAGVSLADSGSVAGETFTATLSDATGDLSATGSGVSGSGTTSLTITGSLSQVNGDLATLTDTDGTTPSDTITLNATDSQGDAAPSQTIAVTVNGLPVIGAPASASVSQNVANAITGLSLSETGNTSGETFTVTLTDSTGTLAATGSGVSGSGSTSLVIAGSLSQVNSALATVTDTEPGLGLDTLKLAASDSFGNAATPASIAVTSQTGMVFNTVPLWNGTSSIEPFGSPDTATYGQTFVAPADDVLDSFTFYLEGSATLQFQAQVYAWSGSLVGGSGSQGATGPALFTSAPMTITSTHGVFEPVTVDTGGLTLTPGDDYVALFTISGPDPTDFTNSSGTDVWGDISGHVANDGGGGFNFYNNGSSYSSLNTTSWDDFSNFGDSAWTAVFAGGSVTPASPLREDLNNDGVSDLLMTDNNNGALVFDEVSNGQMTYQPVGGLGPQWQFEGIGAFLSSSQQGFLIWQAPGAGSNGSGFGAMYVGQIVDGTAQYTPIGNIGPEWEFEGTGAFLGQPTSDFLLYNSENGGVVVASVVNGAAQYSQIGGLGPEWRFEGTGNYLGDGKTGFLLWNSTSGGVVVGEDVNGAAQYTTVGGLGSEWQFVGTGDLLGHGQDDFLIHDSLNGALYVGEVTGGTAQYTPLGGLGPEWQFIGTGNYDGASASEFLLHNSTSGGLVIGAVSNDSVTYTPVGGVGSEWNFHINNIATVA